MYKKSYPDHEWNGNLRGVLLIRNDLILAEVCAAPLVDDMLRAMREQEVRLRGCAMREQVVLASSCTSAALLLHFC